MQSQLRRVAVFSNDVWIPESKEKSEQVSQLLKRNKLLSRPT